VKAIAKRDGVTDRYVSQLIELAFLSPRIVEEALSGSREVRASTKRLVFDAELSTLWSQQKGQIF
jgi:site-specific DNA recombinase